VSSSHARIVCGDSEFTFVDSGSTNGSYVDGARVEAATLSDGAVIELGSTLFVFRETRAPMNALADKVVRFGGDQLFDTLSPNLEEAIDRIQRVARSQLAVLLLGETGTGKEVLAEQIHARSGRPGRFVAVNCGAIPAPLMEAQLFGHMRGSFTGAVRDEIGFVRAADVGTLFLDEVADLPPASQAALLRVLQSGEVIPVGSTRPVHTNVRIVAATHRDLEQLMREGAFRRDLYARLAGFVHTQPSLRERREDLGLLCATLLHRHANDGNVQVRVETARRLFSYDFPLNIRELEQCLMAALVLSSGTPITPSHLPDKLRSRRSSSVQPAAVSEGLNAEPQSPEDAAILEALLVALRETSGNVSESARRMGKARQQVQRWLRRFGLDAEQFR
jgi:DNA-binding NtrC family response regulator